MASKLSFAFKWNAEQIKELFRTQFSNLDPRNPVVWPALPRYTLFLSIVLLVVAVLWLALLEGESELLTRAEEQEIALQKEYKTKLVKAVNLEPLRKQREQVLQYVTRLEKQLPSKAEMDQLLSDINQAGIGRSLQFELFRPGQVLVRDYYAELPIAIRVTGRFHDLGAFASDVAHLSRIVTINNITITPRDSTALSMEATAKTFRYLDNDEISAQRKAAGGGKP